jgi:hypothetical protein
MRAEHRAIEGTAWSKRPSGIQRRPRLLTLDSNLTELSLLRLAETDLFAFSLWQESDRLQAAFKDETFRKLFFEYAQELNDPESRKVSGRASSLQSAS